MHSPPESDKHTIHKTPRQRWMALLARASVGDLERALRAADNIPQYEWLRRPEIGLAMLRGRAGGTGLQFNLGEASVTRCTLRTLGAQSGGYTGVSYVLGRDRRHAELAALFDALLQDEERSVRLHHTLIDSLAAAQANRRHDRSRKAAATRVDFYTMVRGDDGA